MEVVVQVSPDTARALGRLASPTQESNEVTALARRLGGELEQTHPGIDDASLMTFFRYEVPDRTTGERAAQQFLACKGVVSAYWKPSEEPA